MPSLTSFQQSVVNHSQGHARVVAVAGAGKTTTLAHFIRARLEAGTSARRILVLMYNKSAQVDFERRLSQLVESHRPEVRTFHSLGLKIYQRLVADGDLPAFQRDLISESEMEGQVWRMLQQVAEDDETRQDILSQRKKWVEPAVGFIDRVKAGLDSPELVFEALELPTRCRIFIELFERFESWRQSQRRITFADMIYDPVRYLTANSSRAAAFGNHMEWLLVDEYQDINAIQQALLDLLRGERGQVVVIGDPDQTIYEFRGSRPEYMTSEFERRYGSASSYQLPHSFRYGHQVALLANHLIHHNSRRAEVVNVPAAGTPLTRVFRHTSVDGEESSKILSVIQAALANHQPDEIAVICRLWALCAPVELALLQAGLPYQSYTRNTVLDRWELRIFWILFDIASGRFVQRSESERLDAWLTLLTTPFPKIRRADLETLAQNLSHCTSRLGAELQRHIPQSLSRWQKQQLEVRAELIDVAEFGDGSAYRLANDYFEQTELDEGIRDSAFTAQQVEDKLQTIRAFISFLANTNWSAAQACSELENLKERHRQGSKRAGIHLISIHKSKGLEWPVVILPGLNGHYYPYEPEGEFVNEASVESERRLLYVAMTRCQSELHLMTPVVTRQRGRSNSSKEAAPTTSPSQFMREMRWNNSAALKDALQQLITSGNDESKSEPAEEGSCPVLALIDRLQPWYDSYLEISGFGGRLQLEVAKPDPKRTSMQPGNSNRSADGQSQRFDEIQRGQRIRHESLGGGWLVQQSDQYLTIRFDGENSDRVLDTRVASQYLEFLD